MPQQTDGDRIWAMVATILLAFGLGMIAESIGGFLRHPEKFTDAVQKSDFDRLSVRVTDLESREYDTELKLRNLQNRVDTHLGRQGVPGVAAPK